MSKARDNRRRKAKASKRLLAWRKRDEQRTAALTEFCSWREFQAMRRTGLW